MPQEPGKADTSVIQVAKYSRAAIGGSAPPAETTAASTEIRTVATTATHGTIGLRYTPRDPSPTSAKTSP